MRGGAACGGGHHTVTARQRNQCMSAGVLETSEETDSLSKYFYFLTSGWSRREKGEANQHPHRQ